jgi:hypothetical protein
LQDAVTANAEVRESKVRNVSKKAKNIQHGEIVDLPYWGSVEIAIWCRMGGTVTLGDTTRFTTVPAEERLRVRRSHGA